MATKDELAKLNYAFNSNASHYNNVTNHMLLNSMGTKQRAKNFFAISDEETVGKFLSSFSGLNAKDLTDKDGKVNVEKLKRQTELLRRFFVNSNNLLVSYLPKTLKNDKSVKASQAVTKSEFKNANGDGMVDVLSSAKTYLAGLDASQSTKADEKFVQNYAIWVENAINDIKQNFTDAFEEEIVKIKAARQKQTRTKKTVKKEQQSTALITAELANDINRIRQIGLGKVRVEGDKKGMSEEINVEELTNNDNSVTPEDEAREDMLVGVKNGNEVQQETKKKKGGKGVIAGAMAGAVVAGALAGAGIMHHVVDKPQQRELESKYETIVEQRNDYQEKYLVTQSKFEVLRDKYVTLSAEYQELRAYSDEQGETIKGLRKEVEAYKILVGELNNKIKEQDAIIVDLRQKLQNALENGQEEYIADLEQQLADALNANELLNKKFGKALDALEKSEQDYKDLLSKYQAVQQALKDYGVSTVSELANKLEEENRRLQEEVDYYKGLYEQLKAQGASDAELAAARARIAQLEGELSAEKSKNAQLQSTIDTLRQQVIDLQNRIEALEKAQEAGNTQTGAEQGGSGASQMSTGDNGNSSDDQHVNNNGVSDKDPTKSDSGNRGSSEDEDLSKWERGDI